MRHLPILDIVMDAARNEGYNYVEFVCTFNGSSFFSVVMDANGTFEPIGMPLFLLLQNNQVRYANDMECEQICKKTIELFLSSHNVHFLISPL